MDKIERVADALYRADDQDYSCWQDESYMDHYRMLAQAAIDAYESADAQECAEIARSLMRGAA